MFYNLGPRREPLSHSSHDEILRRAVFSFWKHGYAGCSVKHLKEATGLHPGSLYHHFKSKEHLYDRCVNFYLKEMLLPKIHLADSLEALRKFFHNSYRDSSGLMRSTCFLIQATSEVSGHTSSNQAFKEEIKVLEAAFLEKVQLLAPRHVEITALLMDLYIALNLYSEQSISRSALDSKVRERFNVINKVCDGV